MFDFNNSFGSKLFSDKVMKERLSKSTYHALMKIRDEGMIWEDSVADEVASVMKIWAMEQGATHYIHWFSPFIGINSGKHESFLAGSAKDGKPILDFSGKLLSKGESDASSFPSGGLRSTFEARGYTVWDVTSPAFVLGTTLYIPTAFCSFNGDALDQKTPLLRSTQALSKQTSRVMQLLGFSDIKSVTPTVGAEQEYFLIDKERFDKRLDLKLCGRAIFGNKPPKGQETVAHYYGSTKEKVREFMRELDTALWELGVTAKTEHNEVAPGQFEIACVYSAANITCDHNQIVMDLLKKVSLKHKMACLLHEKPFEDLNGSGKHNNYSITTNTGENLLNPGKHPEKNIKFLLTLSAFIKGIDDHNDLIRLTSACPGNDLRLGGNEAPPAIVSIYLGDYLENILKCISVGKNVEFNEESNAVLLGSKSLPLLHKDENDRNRTSPFAFTDTKFEFRMVGASQPLGFVNTVLNSIVTVNMRDFAEKLIDIPQQEREKYAYKIVGDIYKNHKRIIFNGNSYSKEWEERAKELGLSNIKNEVDAVKAIIKPKNIEMLKRAKALSENECKSRYVSTLENYIQIKNVEFNTALEMVDKEILPACFQYIENLAKCNFYQKQTEIVSKASFDMQRKIVKLTDKISEYSINMKEQENEIKSIEDLYERAKAFYSLASNELVNLKDTVNELETLFPKKLWPFPSNTELLFYL